MNLIDVASIILIIGMGIMVFREKLITGKNRISTHAFIINWKRWKRAEELKCPHLRCERIPFRWLARLKDPCPSCKYFGCHNKGKEFDEPERLIILK